jgi:hypothetical protein
LKVVSGFLFCEMEMLCRKHVSILLTLDGGEGLVGRASSRAAWAHQPPFSTTTLPSYHLVGQNCRSAPIKKTARTHLIKRSHYLFLDLFYRAKWKPSMLATGTFAMSRIGLL